MNCVKKVQQEIGLNVSVCVSVANDKSNIVFL